jgi:tetratricopeptide (TPR) repeat protein
MTACSTIRGRSLALAAALGLVLALPAAAATRDARGACEDAIAAAGLRSDAGDYAAALATFDSLATKCKNKKQRVAIQVGRAHALNGSKQYAAAITAADSALKDDKEHLFALFERATANERLGNGDVARGDYERIIALTEKNQNVKERATLYAKVADLNQKAGRTAEADSLLTKAIALDGANPDFAIMEGDWAMRRGDRAAADAAYDRAEQMGVPGLEVHTIRAEGSVRMVQEKHGTTNAQELRAKMTPEEKTMVCTDVNRALSLGWKEPRMDMFAALVCR